MELQQVIDHVKLQISATANDQGLNRDWRAIGEHLGSVAARTGAEVNTVIETAYDASSDIKALWEALMPIIDHLDLPWWKRLFHIV